MAYLLPALRDEFVHKEPTARLVCYWPVNETVSMRITMLLPVDVWSRCLDHDPVWCRPTLSRSYADCV
eukprot:11176921-Lingulodinium_polyedra.AAC.1